LWSGIDPADIPDGLLAGGVIVKANHGSVTNVVLRDVSPDRAALAVRLCAQRSKNIPPCTQVFGLVTTAFLDHVELHTFMAKQLAAKNSAATNGTPMTKADELLLHIGQ
jgi:hypothetical protein